MFPDVINGGSIRNNVFRAYLFSNKEQYEGTWFTWSTQTSAIFSKTDV